MKRIAAALLMPAFACICLLSCKQKDAEPETRLFTRLPAAQTGVDFKNVLTLSEDFDVFRYRNYYNGGGVAIGDINNDGLPDIFLTSNMEQNRLYLNKGKAGETPLTFEDITDKAGILKDKIWSTGVSMADVNGDGLLDIYVCNSGDVEGGNRENELYINNGDLTFTEQAAAYGLADKGFGTHAAFFDYDQDGDLDCYVLNNSFRPVSTLGMNNIRHERDSTGGDKLYRNDSGKFKDVSEAAGIWGSVVGFGLGVTVVDVDSDGWLDIYISNDFFERDYLYINQKNGTFKDELPQRIGHISNFSMGTDAADLNNDGAPEIFVTDMLPEDDRRLKTMVMYDDYDLYQAKLKNDYYEQYMRNTLQLNRGDGNFLEVGQYAGVDATDWSWGALIADFDNDNTKEIFVTNGIERDLIDQDFINYMASEETLLATMREGKADFKSLVEKMPSTKIPNYLFKQQQHLRFQNVAEAWGLAEAGFSNGAAYGDLDGDGDLDLVVNNLQEEAGIYRNNANELQGNHYLKVSLKGPAQNTFGIGARVYAYAAGQVQMLENIPTKGFQSSMDYTLHFGLGKTAALDSLVVNWGYGKTQTIKEVKANQLLQLDIKQAKEAPPAGVTQPNAGAIKNTLFTPVALPAATPHQENYYVDFNRERLIYHMLSKEGPALAIGDADGDGLDDVYVGGASGQPGQLYLQDKAGGLKVKSMAAFNKDQQYEDVRSLFFDANGDGRQDLYVVSGGSEFASDARMLQDRLYLNRGGLQFERCETCLPAFYSMGSTVKAADWDADGDVDLFVGGRAIPGQYGLSAASYLLQNNGEGNFANVTARVSPSLGDFGMVTDAVWTDVDSDKDLDLVVVGEWSAPTIFKNNGANLERLNNTEGLEKAEGWWNSIEATDLDEDGNIDFVVGNWGLNSKFSASPEAPLSLYVADFDDNQTIEQIFAQTRNGQESPLVLRHDLVKQLSSLKKKYNTYQAYAGQSVQNVFSPDQLTKAIRRVAHTLATSVIYNNGDGTYTVQPLPDEVQYSPVRSVLVDDFDGDGTIDLLLSGNFDGTKPEEGRYDANTGIVVKVAPDRSFQVLKQQQTGLDVKGVVSQSAILKTASGKKRVIFARNNETVQLYAY
ncbi:VCBS repeat-containing protein [Cesiribacter sp. SM1]|uniref:VCBS repeat-containing protein n=1 Tax=Cesiribacter sp. SM1 TaxID=2861196 RepID=UPI001CD220D3|nr:VCBS repeat-containing protein [Cesiribacter sp. SM1]